MPAKYNNWAGRGKHWDIPDGAIGVNSKRVNENTWFNLQRGFLLWLADSDYGRDLLHIPKGYGKIDRIGKNHVSFEVQPGVRVTDFRVGAKWGNVVRSNWKEIKEAYIAFERSRYSVLGWKPSLFPIAPSFQYAYTTSTFYPDPDPETTTVDGQPCRQVSQEAWSTIRGSAGTTPNPADNTTTIDDSINNGLMRIINGTSASNGLWRLMCRAVFMFDTSAIPDTDTISSGTLSLASNGSTISNKWTNSSVVDKYTGSSTTSLVSGDYDIGNWAGAEQSSTRIGFGSWSTSGGTYNDHTLNATGLASISKTGVTKFGFRDNNDFDNTEPSPSGTVGSSYVNCRTADYAGTTSDPKLVVVHAGASSAIKDIISMGLLFPR